MEARAEWRLLITAVLIFALAGYCANHPAQAETNLVWSPTGTNRNVGTWKCATDTTRVLTGSSYNSSTIVNFSAVATTANVYMCFADRPIGAGEGCPAGSYTQERMAPKSQARLCNPPPPPACPPPQPAQESRQVQCPEPLVGQWTQTRTYACSAPNWVAGPWLPATPPEGVCAQPQVGNPPRVPTYIRITTNFDICRVGIDVYSDTHPEWIEAQRMGSSEVIRAAPGVVGLMCNELGITTPGEAVLFRFRGANARGPSAWSGYWPLLLFSPQVPPATQTDLDYDERIDYTISKTRTESFNFGCPAEP